MNEHRIAEKIARSMAAMPDASYVAWHALQSAMDGTGRASQELRKLKSEVDFDTARKIDGMLSGLTQIRWQLDSFRDRVHDLM